MKNKLPGKAIFFILFSFVSMYGPVLGQQDLEKTIRYYDSLFWRAYNSCDVENMAKYFTDDLEFYHDKGGLAQGKEQSLENTRKNLCSNSNFRVGREEVPGSTHVFPLAKNDSIYGAIFTGEHLFYITENNNPPRLSGKAKFTHVWLLQNNTWKMSRILSYDHQSAAAQKTAILLPPTKLGVYVGRYKAPRSGQVLVQRETDHLVLSTLGSRLVIFPESETKFFLKDRDLVFEFVKGKDGKVEKMVVWENGKVVEEAVREK